MSVLTHNIDPLALDEDVEKEDTKSKAALWKHQLLTQIPIKVLRGHSDTVSCCCFCFGDTRVLTGSHDKTAVLWDTGSGEAVRTFDNEHSAAISECALTPDSRRLITASWDKTLNAWDTETGKILWKSTQGGLLTSCSISENGKFVTSSSDMEHAIYLSCVETGEKICHIKDHHKSTITRCRFDPQGQHIASVSADKTIKFWDLISHRTTLSINSHHANVISSCSFTTNGQHLSTASWDKTLQLWDIQTGTFRTHGGLVLAKGHDGSISSCEFSDDSSILVSGAFDQTVAVWDAKALCRKLILKGHTDWVMDVAVDTGKKWIASASKDCSVRLWNIENLEDIHEVTETRPQGMGYEIIKCEECGKAFSVIKKADSDFLSKCVFCRLNAPCPIFEPPLFDCT